MFTLSTESTSLIISKVGRALNIQDQTSHFFPLCVYLSLPFIIIFFLSGGLHETYDTLVTVKYVGVRRNYQNLTIAPRTSFPYVNEVEQIAVATHEDYES
jgi:hypothetical protein